MSKSWPAITYQKWHCFGLHESYSDYLLLLSFHVRIGFPLTDPEVWKLTLWQNVAPKVGVATLTPNPHCGPPWLLVLIQPTSPSVSYLPWLRCCFLSCWGKQSLAPGITSWILVYLIRLALSWVLCCFWHFLNCQGLGCPGLGFSLWVYPPPWQDFRLQISAFPWQQRPFPCWQVHFHLTSLCPSGLG